MSPRAFRLCYTLARRVGYGPRAAVRALGALDGVTVPVRNAWYWIRHPMRWVRFQRAYRLHGRGLAEVVL